MRSELTKIVHELVLNSPIPAKALAKEIGKPYSTLLREVNPYDAGAKLGVETLMEIMKKTGNVEPLEYIAQEMGYTIVDPKLMSEPDTAALADSAQQVVTDVFLEPLTVAACILTRPVLGKAKN